MVGTAPVLVGCCEELVLMTTLSDQLRFLIEEGNVTSGQNMQSFSDRHRLQREGFPLYAFALLMMSPATAA